jgi:alkanesulfonate monooxygenase SsuD/methylene tetrahydromethanopterin reductase-like flavin-dependent oxidoreductase (luciferase family)
VTTLNVLSGGRVGLGIGAGWNEDESRGLGFPFPPTAERFGRLEETIRICRQMWSGSEEGFDGNYYHLGRTLNSPQNLRPPYLMIGGGGERKTLRLVAQYADACNIAASPQAEHKLAVLRNHCDAVGRDYDEIEKTTIIPVDRASTPESLARETDSLARIGFTVTYVYSTGIDDPARLVDLIEAAAAITA